MKRSMKRKAFTIIEMTIVIAVIAILAAVMIPAISGMIEMAQVSTDKQNASSLNVQLALWEVTNNREIKSESDLRDAINSVYGDGYYEAEFVPKSAGYGYHYWYEIASGTIVVKSAEDLADSISLTAGTEPFSPASLRSGLVEGYYLLDHLETPNGKNQLTDLVNQFERLSTPGAYENAITTLAAYVDTLKEDGKENTAEHLIATTLADKVAGTTIITSFGAFRYSDAVANAESGYAVYVPVVVQVINVQHIYQYDGTEVPDQTDSNVGSVLLAPPIDPELPPITIDIPSGVAVATNGLPAIQTTNEIDDPYFTNTTRIYVAANTPAELQAMFGLRSTECVIVTPSGIEYILIEDRIYQLPYHEGDEPVVSDLVVTGGGSIDLVLSCPDGDTTAGEDTIFYDSTSNTLYVSYDRTESFTIVATGAPSRLIQWEITDEVNVADENEDPVFNTVPSAWLTADGNTFRINHQLDTGEDPRVTITAKVSGSDASASIDVYLVRPTDVTFDLDKYENISGITDNSTEREAGFDLTFDGENFLYELKNAKVQYNPSGKVKAETVSFSLKSSNYFDLVTKEGKTYLQLKNNLASYNFSETLIATYGEFTVEFKLNMIDNSSKAFEKNWIIADQVQMGEDYLFRVGNENAFNLGILFDNTKAANNIVLEIYDKTAGGGNNFMIGSDSTFKATVANATDATPIKDGDKVIGWQISSNNWKNVTIDFDGKGVALIRIGNKVGDKYDGYEELMVEVVDGKNITAYSQLKTSGNNVLLSDITMTSGGSYKLSNGTLFGNGFTFDVKASATTGTGTITGNHIVYLDNANLDNIKIVGKVYKEFDPLTKSEYSYNRPAVLVQGECGIYNSYISNTASPVRVQNANVLIENTTLKGGSFSNLDIRSGQVTVKNVTTINQVNANDAADDGTVVVGLGITIWYDGTPTETRLTVAGTLTQYNNISSNQKSNATSEYTNAVVSEFFNNSNLSAFRTDGSPSWGNMGIISMIKTFDGNCVLNANGTAESPSGYTGKAVSMKVKDAETGFSTTVSGYVWMIPKANVDSTTVPAAWAPTTQSVIAPTHKFDYTDKNYDSTTDDTPNDYCYYESSKGMVLIGMDQGDKFNWDTSILTVKKNDQTLSYTVSMNGTDYTGKSITFDTEGTYTVVYTYTDSNNYKKDGSSYSVTYTKKVTINVVVKAPDAKNAEFKFWGEDAKTVTIGDKIYVMPNVTGTSSTVGSKNVNGTTVYCPIVTGYTSNGKTSQTSGTTWYMYFPVFKDAGSTKNTFLTITDYANKGTGDPVTYDGNTTALPAGLSVNDPANTFIYGSASTAPTTPSNKNGVLVYTSPACEGVSRDAYNIYAEYSYTDNAGTTYYYIVRYDTPKISNSACVTGDTLVTLADGTQVRVDQLTGNELLKVWDHATGKITSAPIAYIVNHDETISKHNVLKMVFSDGNYLEIIGEHVFFDKTLNKYVAITADNVDAYIGHVFVSNEGEGLKEVVLTDVENIVRNTGVYEVVTYKAITCFTNGILSASAYLDPLLNVFDMNEDTLTYDEAKMMADIATYGLYTYEDFESLVPEEAFEMYNAAYLKIAVGKGYITWDDILDLIDIYYNNDVTPLQ